MIFIELRLIFISARSASGTKNKTRSLNVFILIISCSFQIANLQLAVAQF